jgi:hypothetical protein
VSTPKQLADEEAARVERELEEEAARQDAERPGTIDLDNLDPGEPSEEQMEAMGAENERHLDALRSIMGPASGLFQECKHCDGVGIAPRGPEPKQYERYRQCPTCVGFGAVLTGAQETAQATVPCPGCGGRGFQERTETAQEPATIVQPAGQPEERWGVPSWMGDPSIGPQPPVPVIGS